MAYTITYSTNKINCLPRLAIYGTAVLLLLGCMQWQGVLPEITAVTHLVENLQAGQEITDAIYVFCQEILSHGC